MSASGPIENFIAGLATSEEEISVHTLGARPQHGHGRTRTIGNLVRHGSTSPFCRQVLRGLIRHYKARCVYELGTSLGLTTLYLSDDPDVEVITFEGNNVLAIRARKHFTHFGRRNIRIIEGNIDQTLAQELSCTVPDLVSLDANHRYGPTLDYASRCLQHNENIILVVGDNHWSREMSEAWQVLRKDPRCQISIDLFEMGILIYQRNITPGQYVL
jgi:predicted O-methyltransferase YrrM